MALSSDITDVLPFGGSEHPTFFVPMRPWVVRAPRLVGVREDSLGRLSAKSMLARACIFPAISGWKPSANPQGMLVYVEDDLTHAQPRPTVAGTVRHVRAH